MSEIQPNLQAWQMLRTALADAFKTRADIANLTDFSLAKSIDEIPTDGNDTMSLIGGVIRWCRSHGGNTLQLLLEGALKLRPYHHDLHQIVAQFGVKSPGVKSVRRPVRPSSAAERAEGEIATRQFMNKYPQIESFDVQIWQEILVTLDLEFSIVSASGRTDKRRFGKLVEEVISRNQLQDLESAIQKAARRILDEERERNDLVSRFNRAYYQSDWDKVIALSRNLERLNAHTQGTRNKAVQAYKRRGTRHYDNRDYPSAIECFTQAIHFGSQASQASCYHLRGQAYFALGQYSQALDDFEQAIQRDSSKATYHYWQARCYHAQQQYSKAIEILDRLIAADPQTADYYYWRGVCWFALGNENKAIADLRVATMCNPRHAYAFYELGVIHYYRKNDPISAKTFFGQAHTWGHPDALRYYIDIKDRFGLA